MCFLLKSGAKIEVCKQTSKCLCIYGNICCGGLIMSLFLYVSCAISFFTVSQRYKIKRRKSIAGSIYCLVRFHTLFIYSYWISSLSQMYIVYVHDAKIVKENGLTLQFCSNYPSKMSRFDAMYIFLTNLITNWRVYYKRYPSLLKTFFGFFGDKNRSI